LLRYYLAIIFHFFNVCTIVSMERFATCEQRRARYTAQRDQLLMHNGIDIGDEQDEEKKEQIFKQEYSALKRGIINSSKESRALLPVMLAAGGELVTVVAAEKDNLYYYFFEEMCAADQTSSLLRELSLSFGSGCLAVATIGAAWLCYQCIGRHRDRNEVRKYEAVLQLKNAKNHQGN